MATGIYILPNQENLHIPNRSRRSVDHRLPFRHRFRLRPRTVRLGRCGYFRWWSGTYTFHQCRRIRASTDGGCSDCIVTGFCRGCCFCQVYLLFNRS